MWIKYDYREVSLRKNVTTKESKKFVIFFTGVGSMTHTKKRVRETHR